MFRLLFSHLQVVVLCKLRNLLLVVFRSFLVLHLAIASVVVCLVSLELVYVRTLRSVRRLLVTASVVPTSPILVTLMKEALSY
jgi:hypothetical protein